MLLNEDALENAIYAFDNVYDAEWESGMIGYRDNKPHAIRAAIEAYLASVTASAPGTDVASLANASPEPLSSGNRGMPSLHKPHPL